MAIRSVFEDFPYLKEYLQDEYAPICIGAIAGKKVLVQLFPEFAKEERSLAELELTVPADIMCGDRLAKAYLYACVNYCDTEGDGALRGIEFFTDKEFVGWYDRQDMSAEERAANRQALLAAIERHL